MLSDNFELRYEADANSINVKILSTKTTFDLPHNFHFSAVIYEMQKQYYHGKRWYDSKIETRMEEQSFRFKRWKSALHNDLEHMAKQKK